LPAPEQPEQLAFIQPPTAGDDRRGRFREWRDRVRDPSLTAVLVLQMATMFFAVPLAARGWPAARVVGDALVLAAVAIVVLLSNNPGAGLTALSGLAAFAVSQIFGAGWDPTTAAVIRRGAEIVTLAALLSVISRAVYAPGRITSARLQGAAIIYLTAASLFASAYGLIWALNPGAFANLHGAPGSDQAIAALQYFSLTTLTTVGYGDILAVDPFARSLANLEAVLGVFYIAITVTRLVTLELAGRRR
jgi:Ion channel